MTSFIPPWMDTMTLAKHISVSPSTVENWVAQGILPPGRKRGGKLMWKWLEVDEALTNGGLEPDAKAKEVRDGTRRAAAEARARH